MRKKVKFTLTFLFSYLMFLIPISYIDSELPLNIILRDLKSNSLLSLGLAFILTLLVNWAFKNKMKN